MNRNTIIVFEDEAIVAEDLAIKLRQSGYEVAGTAVSGEEALILADLLQAGDRTFRQSRRSLAFEF